MASTTELTAKASLTFSFTHKKIFDGVGQPLVHSDRLSLDVNFENPIDSGLLTINVVAVAGTYTRTTGSFLDDGFVAGDTIIASGFTNAGNNTTKIISTVTDTVITVTSVTGLVNESGGGDERVKIFEGAADELYMAQRTIAASGNETLDLYGSLTNLLGDTINALRIKGVFIILEDGATQADSITYGNGTNQFVGPAGAAANTHKIQRGGWWGWSDPRGFAVVNASTDAIKIVNNDSTYTATYTIVVLATH